MSSMNHEDTPVGTPDVAGEDRRPSVPRHWKSLAELERGMRPQAEVHHDLEEKPLKDPLSRRNFFRLMGASMAMAGVAGPGCQRYEREEIVPLARRPEDQVPGNTLKYASVFELAGVGQPVLVTSYEGRPLHVDGNPQHPFSGDGLAPTAKYHRHGGSTAWAQASVLNVYDQDRSRALAHTGKGGTFDDFKVWVAKLREQMNGSSWSSVRILSEAMSSPTLAKLRAELIGKGAQWVEWEPISFDNERAGLKAAYGRPLRTYPHLDKAETIVVLDGDIFVEHPAAMRFSRDWRASRGPEGSTLGQGAMNRLWSVESTFTQTGATADHRLPLRSELILPLASALKAAITGTAAPRAEFLAEAKVSKFVAALAAELKGNRGRAVVIAGRRQPPEVHALVAFINEAIGAVGTTVDYLDVGDDRPTHREGIANLVGDMNAGRVKTLFILGGNPVYDAPADLDFLTALSKVETSVHLSEWDDETSAKCTWHVPRANYLEAWGDARAWDGTWTVAQPLIMPLYGGISALELVAMLTGSDRSGEGLVRAAVEGAGKPWRQSVHDGFVEGSQFPVARVQGAMEPSISIGGTRAGGSRLGKDDPLEVVFHYSYATWDGRFANNAWLQELPDFFTKLVWDNYGLVAPATAQDKGLKTGEKMKIKLDGRELEIVCYVMPGQAPSSIGLMLGYGRTRAGSKGGQHGHTVGFDTYKLRSMKSLDFAGGATVASTGERYKLSGVQEHWDLPHGWDEPLFNFNVGDSGAAERLPELVQQVDETKYHDVDKETGKLWDARNGKGQLGDELWREPGVWVDKTGKVVHGIPPDAATAKQWGMEPKGRGWVYTADKSPVEELPKTQEEGVLRGLVWKKGRNYSLFHEHVYEGRRWAMTIDLGACTSCNACVIACQSENNIPVVGKEEVVRNREMHWIRIDRYFEGSPDDPRIVNQPVACQQCENAPCEQVCPVGATQHSDEGLNDMVYNRCIGTRYCLNNCPYRVRRFNFLDWNKEFKEARNRVRKLVLNPEVTVRMRGVMEKCTYCVQRIERHKIVAKNERRELVDGEISTACQDACPTGAIVFGDLTDTSSWVTALANDRRAYGLLAGLNTRPRTQFLARVRNPNPTLG